MAMKNRKLAAEIAEERMSMIAPLLSQNMDSRRVEQLRQDVYKRQLQDELYHPVINNGPAVLVCVDKRLGTGPVNQSRDAG